MKKIVSLFLVGMSMFILASCGGKGADLIILNWGDYISDELVRGFEEEYGVSVRIATTDSNEQMYSSIVNQNAEYDLVVPSDYMLDQMKQDGLINEIDFSKLENYTNDLYVEELQTLIDDNASGYKNYFIPYFWGSLGIMYNKKITGVEEAVLENGYKVFFEQNLLPTGSKVGMYNSSRDSLAAAEMYLGYSLNTKSTAEIDECMNLLKSTSFSAWGTDDLKIKVSQGNLDVALVYSGDFFDAYYSDVEAGSEDNLDNYSIYSPAEHNNVFFDGIAIAKTVTNEELAYKFLDYILVHDNSYLNAEFVGYCPTIQSVYNQILEDEEGWGDITAINSYDPAKIINQENSRAEVYAYLGSDIYSYIERKFTEVLS